LGHAGIRQVIPGKQNADYAFGLYVNEAQKSRLYMPDFTAFLPADFFRSVAIIHMCLILFVWWRKT
jgi:hypothetical protein